MPQDCVTLQSQIWVRLSFGRRTLYFRCVVMSVGRQSVLKNVEVVAGSDGDDVFFGMPGGMEDFLPEVQTVHADVRLFPFLPHTHAPRLQDGTPLAHLTTGLQSHVTPARPVKHSEVVVVRPRHYHAVEEERD